ncbi:GNAT family N-acetyltransferase [Novosphingobium aquimarinum]|uniref:GNAT family N-acetyltransferase n=1 Tax=Novosphingobium aquimarinum TaxID=2682494 RepID=UPI0018DEC03B|nr:GNAT family N-acetyltransferase [Novosphingobium aquimarinum]
MFFTPEMLLPALAHFDPANEVTLFCALERAEPRPGKLPRLIGLVPLISVARYRGLPARHLAVWRHNHSFLGTPLIARGHEDDFWQQLLRFADQSVRAPFLRIEKLHADGCVAQSLARVATGQRRPVTTTSIAQRALLQSDLDPEAYLAKATRAKKRKELRRMMHRLRDIGEITFQRHRSDDGLDPWLSEFLELEAGGWKQREGTAIACRPQEERFFRQAMSACADRGMLERIDMRLDGRPLAMLLNLHCAPGAFGFKTSYDEEWSRYSPGVQLQIENLEVLADPAVEWMDSCAAENHPMIDHLWVERRKIVSCNIALGGPLRRLCAKAIATAEAVGRRLSGRTTGQEDG